MRGMGRDASGVDGLARPWWAAWPGPASGGGDGARSGEHVRLKDLTHLSRIGCPGWKTGTKASSEPGLHALSVVVVARLI